MSPRHDASVVRRSNSKEMLRVLKHMSSSSIIWWTACATAAPQSAALGSPFPVIGTHSALVQLAVVNGHDCESTGPIPTRSGITACEWSLTGSRDITSRATLTVPTLTRLVTPAIIMSGFVAQDERESTAPKQPANSSQQGGVEPARPIVQGAENAPLAEEISPKLEEAVQRGFEALRRMQKSDGSFGQGRFGEHVGITSLCAIALMADGNVPGRGEFGDCVQKALDFVLSHSTETGLLVSDDTHGPMYGHGFATLFLGEIYGMNQDDDRVRDALVRAVQLIVSSQNNEGGWRYNPIPADADVSVTICEIMALRSARNAGIKVPKSTIDDAIRYVRSCQNDDGGFRYMKEVSGSAWPRTAAGIASLFYAGIYEDQSIDRGLDYLTRNAFPRGAGGVGVGFSQQHYFYGHYYAVQAMYLAGGERWKNWWPAIREELIAKQNPDGTWTDQQIGDAYGTAMALIVLQMPKRYLPIFQR